MPGVSRIAKDSAKRLLKATPQQSVFVNDQFLAATEGSVDTTGDIVIASDVTVYVENKKIAVEGAVMASGSPIGASSQTVFAGKIGP